MSPRRRLVYRFMELPHVHQLHIAERLGVEYDGMSQHDMQVTTLRYASEGHLLATMWEWMNEFDDVREANPFEAKGE